MRSRIRLAVVSTHPIQYQVPLFRWLASQPGLDLIVYYALIPNEAQQGIGFNAAFSWDIPLLDGYAWKDVGGSAADASLARFFGTRIRGLRREFRDAPPDVVLVTGWHSWALVQATALCALLSIPRIVRGESNALRARPLLIRLMHRAYLSLFDAVLAIGRSNRDFYAGNGVASDRIFESPYFVDNERFRHGAAESRPMREAIRAEYSIAPASVCFAFVGKLEPKKRVSDLIRAIRLADHPAAHLLVIGTGPEESALREQCRREGVKATFAGFLNQSELPRAYVAADCLVLPSDHGETWGLVVNEAMATGLPAIVSDHAGSAWDLVQPGSTGHKYPCGDVAALAGLVRSLCEDPGSLRIMGMKAQEFINQYSVEKAAQGVLSAARYAVDGGHHEQKGGIVT